MEELFKIIGISSVVSTVIIGIVSFIGRKFIEQNLSRDLEKYKSELSGQSEKNKLELQKELEKYRQSLDHEGQITKVKLDQQIESFKSDLNLIHTRQSKLYDRQREVLETVYEKIVTSFKRMLEMTSMLQWVEGDPEKEEEDRIKVTADAGNDFIDFYDVNRIYFSPTTCVLLENLKTIYIESFNDYTMKKRFGIPTTEFNTEKANTVSERIRKEIPPVLEKLEEDFRKLIGVIEGE